MASKPTRSQIQLKRNFSNNACCICGSQNCLESTDHKRITLPELHYQIKYLIFQENTEIQKIKEEVKSIFKALQQQLFHLIKKSELEIQIEINKLKIVQECTGQMNKQLISEIMEDQYVHLPSKQIKKITSGVRKIIRNGNKSPVNHEESMDLKQSCLQNIRIFMNKIDIKQLKADIQTSISIKNIKEDHLYLELLSKKGSKKISSSDTLSNPEECSLESLKEFQFEWKRIKVKQSTKNIQLSSRNLTDQEVILNVPILSHFKNLQEFAIRNNKITGFSCAVIASNLQHLLRLDLRINNINDFGLIKIIKSLKLLKNLYISETKAGDESGKEIASGLPELELFWSENTFFTGEVGLAIAQKPNLRVLSLIGNNINKQYSQKITDVFRSKGYINI